jgi:hypothetical protein
MEPRTEGRILGVVTGFLVLTVDVSLVVYARGVVLAKSAVLPPTFPLAVLVIVGPTIPVLVWAYRRFQRA